MRVVTVNAIAFDTWELGLVGVQTQLFRSVPLSSAEIRTLKIQNAVHSYTGDCELLRLGLQAYSLGIAYEFDPYFGLSISRVDPLPHQLEAVYDHLLKPARVRFLLADAAAAPERGSVLSGPAEARDYISLDASANADQAPATRITLRDPGVLGNLVPASPPSDLPAIAHLEHF